MKQNPGCFGHASIYNAKSPICSSCECASGCSKEVGEKLKAFAKKADVGDFLKRHQDCHHEDSEVSKVTVTVRPSRTTKAVQSKKVFTAREQEMLNKLAVKPRNELRKIIEAGQHKGLCEALQAGQNPFPYDGKRYLHVACAMLLEGGCTKASLRERYMNQLGWTQSTAFPHVAMVCAMFEVLGVAVEEKGTFSLNPTSNK